MTRAEQDIFTFCMKKVSGAERGARRHGGKAARVLLEAETARGSESDRRGISLSQR